MDGLKRLKTYRRVTPGQSSIFIFRKYGEQEYFAQLNVIMDATTEGWYGQNIVTNALLCLYYPLFVAELRHLDKRTPCQIDYFRHELRMSGK